MENVVGDDAPNNEEFRFQTVGEQLRAERIRQGLTLNDVATRTRVPMRHLESIENSQFSNLPGSTYTLGFTRSYARSLDMDAAKIGSELRAELAQGGHDSYNVPTPNFQPADASRVPSKTLAWTAAGIAVLLLAGYLIWRSFMLDSGASPEPTSAPAASSTLPAQTSSQAPAAVTQPTGEVVLTATDTVWIKVYDADNKRLFESEMKAGDQYHVPADANKPMIVTGRPQKLNVTIGGKPVAPLGTSEKTVADLEISAAALSARLPEPATTNPSPTTGGNAP